MASKYILEDGTGGYLLETPATTYYFNASTVAASDPAASWTFAAGAFDGDPQTNASSPSISGSASSNYLSAGGTNAPTSGGTISQVQARMYHRNNASGSNTAIIYSAGQTQILGTINDSATVLSYTSYITLTAPSGGWTWTAVHGLETKLYHTIASTGVGLFYQIEILVTTSSAADYYLLETPVVGPVTIQNTIDYNSYNSGTPKILMTASAVAYDDVNYEIQIDTVNTFNSVSGTSPLIDKVSSSDTGFANTVTTSDTAPFNSGETVGYTVQAANNLADGVYYWRVRAIDPSGSNLYGAWSTTRNFLVNTSVGVQFISSSSSSGTSTTLSNVYAGDLVVVFAYSTSTTVPTPAVQYTKVSSNTGNSNAYVLGTLRASGGETSTGTFTGAAIVAAHVYRNVPILSVSNWVDNTSAASTTIATQGMAPWITSDKSWWAVFAGSRQSTSLTSLSGLTSRTSRAGTSSFVVSGDTNAVTPEVLPATTTAGASATSVSVTYEIPGDRPNPDYLFDTFDGTSLNTYNWSPLAGGGTVAELGGTLNLTIPANVTNASAWIQSNHRYTLYGKSIRTKVADIGDKTLSSYQVVPLYYGYDSSNYVGFWLLPSLNLMYISSIAADIETRVLTLPYDPSVHKYFGLKESAGVTTWEYSTNGITWTTFGTLNNQIDYSVGNLYVGVSATPTVPSSNTVKIEAFNAISNIAVGEYSNFGTVTGTTYTDQTASAWIGKWAGVDENGFITYSSVQVPKNATITSACIRLYAHGSDNDQNTMSFAITAEAADNASPITDSTTYNAITSTTASVNWTRQPVRDGEFNTVDMSPVIQEVINRSGWSSGNSMNILIKNSGGADNTDMNIKAPGANRLVIKYTTYVPNVAYRSSQATQMTLSVTSVTPTLPAGIQANDCLIMHVALSGTATAPNTPAGWTPFSWSPITDGTSFTSLAYYKIATSSETNPTVTWTTANKGVVQIVAYSGVDTVNPIITSAAAANTTSSTSNTTPSLTNTDATAWAVMLVSQRTSTSGNQAITFTPASGMTERLDTNISAAGSSPWNGAELADSNGPVTVAAHSYSATSNFSESHHIGALIYLKPATSTPITVSTNLGRYFTFFG